MSVHVDDVVFTVNEPLLGVFLNGMKYPEGLQEVLLRGLKKVPIRFFLIDNSGSMSESDGNVLVKHGKNSNMFISSYVTEVNDWNIGRTIL